MFDVVIIGGGAAGLAAARQLNKCRRVSFVLLEADRRVGGRLRKSAALGVNVDLGAEILHGSTTELSRLCAEAQLPTVGMFTCSQGDGGPDDELVNGRGGYYYYGGQLRRFDELCEQANAAHEVLWSLASGQRELSGSLADVMRAQGVPERVCALLDAGYANTCGADSMSELSARNTVLFERDWALHDGCAEASDRRVADDNESGAVLSDVVSTLRAAVGSAHIRLNSVVTAVERRGATNVVRLADKSTVEAKAVIVSVPIGQLQRGKISFRPTLARAKQTALSALRVRSGRKIMLKYDAAAHGTIWPNDCSAIVFADEAIPEAWFRMNVKGVDGKRYHVAVGFATAKWRDALAKRFANNDQACAALFDRQLRRVFGNDAPPPPLASLVFDWTRDAPFVECAYSTPSLIDNESDNAQLWRALAEPERQAGRFWAGEHCAWPHASMTVHAALFSGLRAANDAMQFLKRDAKL